MGRNDRYEICRFGMMACCSAATALGTAKIAVPKGILKIADSPAATAHRSASRHRDRQRPVHGRFQSDVDGGNVRLQDSAFVCAFFAATSFIVSSARFECA